MGLPHRLQQMWWGARLDRGFLTKNGQAGTENPWTFQPAARTRDYRQLGQGFLVVPRGIMGEGNPCLDACLSPHLLESVRETPVLRCPLRICWSQWVYPITG